MLRLLTTEPVTRIGLSSVLQNGASRKSQFFLLIQSGASRKSQFLNRPPKNSRSQVQYFWGGVVINIISPVIIRIIGSERVELNVICHILQFA